MRNIKKEAERLASLSYSMEVLRDETTDGRHIFMAKCIELEGCMAQGETIGEAMENLQDAMIVYIESLLEDKLPVPYPREGSIKTVGTLDSSVGAASLKLSLSQGRIEARHGDDETPLYSGTADEKSWDKIIAAIVESCADGVGPMAKRN